MWKIDDFKKWDKCGRPINENVIKLNITYSKIKILGNLENLVNLKILQCNNNLLTSLKGIENLVNLEELNCENNKLT
jgi:Leucine-rich repeat (LRR) protein